MLSQVLDGGGFGNIHCYVEGFVLGAPKNKKDGGALPLALSCEFHVTYRSAVGAAALGIQLVQRHLGFDSTAPF